MHALSSPSPGALTPPLSRTRTLGRAAVIALAGVILLLALVVVHVQQGAAALDPATVLSAIVAPDASPEHAVVRHARLPRVAAGVVAGSALAIAGVLLQAATRNPLASASTIGVNAGAYLAVVAATIFAPALMGWSSPLVAFAGGLLAAGAVYLLASGDAAPSRLALAGMATTIALGSVTTTLIMFHEYTVGGLFFWGAGSLVQRNWDLVAGAWPWVAALGLFATVILARQLDVYGLGDDVSASLGQDVPRTRLVTTLIGVLLAAFAITVAGPVAFVGLVAAHLVRLAGVRGHAQLIPLAALWGAVLLVAADVVGRLVAGPMSELPAGIFTAAVGAPFLIWLARRAGQAGGRRAAPPAPVRTGAAISPAFLWGGTLVALLVAVTAGLAFGDQFRSLPTLLGVVTGNADGMTRDFVLNLRLPRVLVAGLVGAALAVSGLLIQGVVRNPLAAPDLVGIAPGAGVGAVALLVAVPGAPIALLPVAAFAGGVAAFALVYAASWAGGASPTRLVLVGVGVSAAAASLTTIMVVQAEFSMTTALAWLSGSTYAKQWSDVVRLLPWLAVLLPAAWLTARWLDLMALGEDLPRGLGLPLERARLALLGIAVGLAAAAVATAGTIGFVGLIAPHAARMLAPGRHRLLIPFTALLGAILVIVADMVGRSVLPPNEIASGLITAMLGAPYFLWLLTRTRGAGA